jgi:tetratricopeptide (TPR) repeat protein
VTLGLLPVRSAAAQEHEADPWVIRHFQLARQAQFNNDADAAIGEYQLIIAKDPTIAEVYANLGILYHQQKRYSEAVGTLKKAASLDPGLLSAQLFLGLDEYLVEDFKAAREHLQNAIKLSPTDRQAGLYLALTYLALDEPVKAARQLRRTARSYPDDPEVSYQLGEAYLEAMRQGLVELKKAGNRSPLYLWALAGSSEEKGDLVAAMEHYLEALAIDPDIAELYWRLGSAFRRAGLPQFEAVALERYHQLNPARDLAIAHTEDAPQGPRSDATVISPSVELISRMWRAVPPLHLGSSLPPIANTAMNRRIKQRQETSPELKEAVKRYLRGDFTGAAEKLKRDPLRNPGDWIIAYVGASAYLHSGAYDEAALVIEDRLLPYLRVPSVAVLAVEVESRLSLRYFDQLIAHQPDSYRAKLLLAKSDEVAGRFEKAQAEYGEALNLAPDRLGIHLALGQLNSQQLRWPAAVEEFKDELALDPANAMAKAELAHAYVKTRESEQAIELLSQLLKSNPTDVQAYADLGDAWEQKREPFKAIAAYERALACDGSQNSLHYKLFRLYGKVGEGARAQSHLTAFKSRRGAEKQGISGGNCRPEVKGPAGGARILIVA